MQLKVTTCFVPNTLYLERDIDCRIDLIDQIKIQQIFFDHVWNPLSGKFQHNFYKSLSLNTWKEGLQMMTLPINEHTHHK